MDMWLVFFWSGPIGIGVFLVSLGILIWLTAKADAIKKDTKRKDKE